MSSNRKELKKTLKGPDKFQSSMAVAMDWVRNNQGQVALLVAPVILTLAGVWGYQAYTSSAQAERVEAFGKIESQYRDELQQAEEQRGALGERLTALEGRIAKAKGKEKSDLETQREALNNQIAAVEPDHKKSADQYVEFYEQHGKYSQGWAAGMKAVAELLNRKEYARAKELLTGIVDQSKSSEFYQTQARLTLINTLEQLNENEAALKVVDELHPIVEETLKPNLLLMRGRILMALNRNDDAKKEFDELVNKHGSSPEATKARTMSAILNG